MRENVLKATVGEKSLKDLLKRFQAESYRMLQNASESSVFEAVEMGVGLAQKSVSEYPAKSDLANDLPTVTRTDISSTSGGNHEAEILLQGESAVFFEFGAGKYYNTPVGSSPHPEGVQRGYVIGSYPGQTHAGDEHWYLPKAVKEKYGIEKTHGVMAIMPLHNTKVSIINYAKNKAKR